MNLCSMDNFGKTNSLLGFGPETYIFSDLLKVVGKLNIFPTWWFDGDESHGRNC